MSADLRPRYGRIAALVGAVLSTVVSLSGGLGLVPAGGSPAAARPEGPSVASLTALEAETGIGEVSSEPVGAPSSNPTAPPTLPDDSAGLVVPADAGDGRRVVLDLSRQRVWLVDETPTGKEEVARSYLVSGSLTDNLGPGDYEVYSRSRYATGIDGSSMQFMVRFTQGDNAAIGFHDIPTIDDEPVQTRDQLGTPLSHGCVRQARPDAVALWRFAQSGTPVIVRA